jgi:plastocyanin
MNRTSKVAVAVAAAVLGVSGLAACGNSSSPSSVSGSSSSTSTTASPSASASSGGSSPSTSKASIMIKDFKFTGTTDVAAGTKITIMNMDTQAHTVTADSGNAFDVKIDPGATVTLTAPSKPGTYAYHCRYHSNMHGTLKVS